MLGRISAALFTAAADEPDDPDTLAEVQEARAELDRMYEAEVASGKRWRVGREHKVVLRKSEDLDSENVGVLETEQLVAQLGKFVRLDNGIVRMRVQPITETGAHDGAEGWATFDATKAKGPLFFEDVVAPEFLEVLKTEAGEQAYGRTVMLKAREEFARQVREGEVPDDKPSEMAHFKFFRGVLPWFMVGVGSTGGTQRNERPEGFEDNPLPDFQKAGAASDPKGKGKGKGPSDDVNAALETLRKHCGLVDTLTNQQLLEKIMALKKDGPAAWSPVPFTAPTGGGKGGDTKGGVSPEEVQANTGAGDGAKWQVRPGQTVHVRQSIDLTSPVLGIIQEGQLCTQSGRGQRTQDGVVRMPIKHPYSGWITVTAFAAGGPTFVSLVQQKPNSGTSAKTDYPSWRAMRGDVVVRQDSALQSPNLPNAWIQEGDMLQQVADIVKVQVPGANITLERLKLRCTTGQEGWVTKCAKHAGGPTYFVKLGPQDETAADKGKGKGRDHGSVNGTSAPPPPPNSLDRYLFSVGARFRLDRNAPLNVTEDKQLNSAVLIALSEGAEVTQEYFPQMVNGNIRLLITHKRPNETPAEIRGWVTACPADATLGNFTTLESPPSKGVMWRAHDRKVLIRKSAALDSDRLYAIEEGQRLEQLGPAEVVQDCVLRMPVSSAENRSMPGWATVFALEETPEGYKKTTLLEREQDQGGAEKGDGKGRDRGERPGKGFPEGAKGLAGKALKGIAAAAEPKGKGGKRDGKGKGDQGFTGEKGEAAGK